MARPRVVVSLVVAAAMVATACGARLNDEQVAALGARGSAENGTGTDDLFGSAAGTPIAGDPVTTPQPDPAEADTTNAASPGTGAPGAATADTSAGAAGGIPTGGPTAGPTADAGTCTGGGATDVGVSETTVTLGNVSLLSGPIQGFANTAVGATKAFINYQNSRRGICGRALELQVADDRFDSGVNRAEYERLAREVLAFVGGLSVVDDGGATFLRGTNISDVSLVLSDAKLALSNVFAPTPIAPDGLNTIRPQAEWLRKNEGITQYALIWPAQATARNRARGFQADFEAAGLTQAFTQEVGVTETNYAPAAKDICDRQPGKTLLTTALEVNGMARLAKALKQQGCIPRIANFGAQAYGQQFIDLAGDAAEGATIISAHDIVEGSTNPLTKSFVEWFTRTNPGLVLDYFAVQSWIASHMLATALRAVGAELTRDRLLAELKRLDGYTAEDMTGPINPGKKQPTRCFLLARVKDGKWTRYRPSNGFVCA